MKTNILTLQVKAVFIGLDLHKKTWYLTARCEGIELKQWSMAGKEMN